MRTSVLEEPSQVTCILSARGMLNARTDTGSGEFRTELWKRAQAMQARVIADVASGDAAKADVLEDLWSEMLADAVRPPGRAGALEAGAELWTDKGLRAALRKALVRDYIDHYRRQVDAEGQPFMVGAPLEDLEGAFVARAAGSAESVALGAAAAQDLLEEIDAVAGAEVKRMVVAKASGLGASEQMSALGNLSRPQLRTLQDRLEIASSALRQRARAALGWLLPEFISRWLAPAASSGSLPRVSGIGLLVTAALASGAGVTASHSNHTEHGQHRGAHQVSAGTTTVTRRPAADLSSALRSANAAATKIEAANQAKSRAHARDRRSATAQTRRRRNQSAAAAASATDADREFAPEPITAAAPKTAPRAPSSPSSGSASTSSAKSAADAEFGLGG